MNECFNKNLSLNKQCNDGIGDGFWVTERCANGYYGFWQSKRLNRGEIDMNKDMNRETNLEHFKEELKEIFVADEYPSAIAYKIANRLDENIKCGAQTCYIEDILDWMAQPYKEQILDKVEKEYLSNFIKPFRDRVKSIYLSSCNGSNRIYVIVKMYDSYNNEVIGLPCFKAGTMYKGMKDYKYYSVKELGL